MGFRLNRTYSLEFEGAMEGAVVKLRSTTAGKVIEMRAADAAGLAALLADHVLEWNLEDTDGQPLPVTAEAILGGMEEVVLAAIIREWYKAATGVTAPLDGPSTDSGPSLELSI